MGGAVFVLLTRAGSNDKPAGLTATSRVAYTLRRDGEGTRAARGKLMTTELQGKVGLVTVGTSGIGRDAAVLFAKAGA